MIAQRIGGYTGSNNSFGKATIGRDSLRSILERKTAGLNFEHERRFAEVCNFRVDWPEWQTGTAHEFIERYERDHNRAAKEGGSQRDRQLGLRLQPRRLSVEPVPGHPALAAIDLAFHQAGPNEPWPVSVDLICQPTPLRTFQLGVRRGRLELDPGEATIHSNSGNRLGGDGPVTFSRSTPDRDVTVEIANANSRRPAWTISSSSGPIGIFRLDDEQHLCALTDIAPGDVITAVFKVFVKDLEPWDADPNEDEDDDPHPYSFLRADGKALSAAKRKIIKARLIKDELSVPASGFVTVAVDARSFEKGAPDDS